MAAIEWEEKGSAAIVNMCNGAIKQNLDFNPSPIYRVGELQRGNY